MTSAEVADIIAEVDVNGDGKLNYDEVMLLDIRV